MYKVGAIVRIALTKMVLVMIAALFIFPQEALAANVRPGVYYGQLERDLKNYLGDKQGTYGVYVVDLLTGSSFGINEEEVFYAASTVKLPLALYVLNLVKEGKIDLDKRLVYMEDHFEEGTGHLQYDPYGTAYRVEDLLRGSIVVSDNVATNILLDAVGYPNVKKFMRDMGGKVVDDERNLTCPVDMANYMLEVLLFSSHEPLLGGLLMDALYKTVFNERIPALLPEGTPVAHKVGTWPPTGSYNDVGYVEHPSRPFIISVFSKDVPSAGLAFQRLRQISRKVYDYQSCPDLSVDLFFNGQKIPLKRGAILGYSDKQVLVPLKELAAHIPGLRVYWKGVSRQVVVTSSLTRNYAAYGLDDGLVVIIDGQSYLPVHRLAGDFNYSISWDVNMHRFYLQDSFRMVNWGGMLGL